MHSWGPLMITILLYLLMKNWNWAITLTAKGNFVIMEVLSCWLNYNIIPFIAYPSFCFTQASQWAACLSQWGGAWKSAQWMSC